MLGFFDNCLYIYNPQFGYIWGDDLFKQACIQNRGDKNLGQGQRRSHILDYTPKA
jgi:hypothetical protein